MAKVTRIDHLNAQLTWQQALSDFISFKQAQGLSKTTITDYTKHITQFFRRYPDCWPSEVRSTVLNYLSGDIAPATHNLRLAYLKNFFAYCAAEGVINDEPLRGIKKRRDEGRVRNVEEEVLKALLRLPNQRTFAGLRDYSLLLLTLDTGIRPGEALKLTVDDIDLTGRGVTVEARVSKTRRTRALPIGAETVKALRRLTNARHPEWNADTPVFCSYEGKPMNCNGWYQRIAIYSDKLGVKIRPYDLRHSFSLMYLKNGGHAFALQHTLGHTSMEMTKRYVNMSEQDLAEAHRAASPLNRLLNGGKRVRRCE